MKCVDCGCNIPPERLDILPDVEYCLNCADNHIEPVKGYMIYPHKTGGELFIARGNENIRRLKREYARAR
jgi:hypothetical protein